MRFGFITLLVGICSGLGGMGLAMLLHAIQHLAYGDVGNFFQDVVSTSTTQRIFILILCGLLSGIGWWLIQRFGKKLVTIPQALNSETPSFPLVSTLSNSILQIIVVALGSPLGREVAPREIGALIATWLSNKAKLDVKDTKILLACGAGAGLAAVYNVPFAGAIFVLEVLLQTFSWRLFAIALVTSTIATITSWIGLDNEAQYQISNLSINYSLIVWSILTGPIFGLAGFYFKRLSTMATQHASSNWRLIPSCLFNFSLIGLLAVYFPALLGNGKSPAQLEFSDDMTISLSVVLLVLRILITSTTLRAGAHGGLLTPSLANGALLGVVLGGVWNLFLPGPSLGSFAIVGATAFLASAQRMPVTAIAIMFELTHVDLIFVIPMLFAVGGAQLLVHHFPLPDNMTEYVKRRWNT